MRISVIGTGYVGLVSGTCFAEIGHDVTCIDIDQKKIDKLKEGISPIHEPGLSDYLKSNYKKKRLHFDTSYESVKTAEAVFLAVGTPSLPSGEANLEYIYSALDQVIETKTNAVIVIKSTVPIGTNTEIKEYLKSKNVSNEVVNNPEFLREGSAVRDFLYPDRIVLGFTNEKAGEIIAELYKPLVRQGNPIYMMSNLSAEMTKYAANSFLAAKVSFINEVARLCDATGADIEEVKKGISSDKRIGGQFLYPGPGYGGSCFPKDVKALKASAKKFDVPLKLVPVIDETNDDHKNYIAQKILNHFNNDLKGKTIALWGVAFKANTDDVRETPALNVVEKLSKAGAIIKFYDPCAGANFKEVTPHEVEEVFNMYDVLQDADALVTITEWREFQTPDFEKIKSLLKNKLIFDFRNLFDSKTVKNYGFQYYSIGKNQ